MYVIPRPILSEVRHHPLVRSLYPTDIGWYPQARYHYRDRPEGALQDHLMMCVDGQGVVEIDGEQHTLGPEQLLIIPRNCRHTYWADEAAPWSIYWMHFLGEDAAYYLDRMPGPGMAVAIDGHTLEEAKRLFRDCLDALESGYSLPNLIYAAQSARHVLSLLLFRNRALPMQENLASRQRQLESIIGFMQANVREQLCLRDLAQHAGHSVSHFSEWFRDQTGQSPMAYFIQLKIRLACRLLDLSEQSIKSVALEVGYSDPYYFSRVFKKVMGISPRAYVSIKKG